VKLFLDFNFDNKEKFNGYTAFQLACGYRNLKIVKCFVKYNPDVLEVLTNDGETPLHLACKNGRLEIVKFLVEECDADIEATDKNKQTPFFVACEVGEWDIVKYLVGKQKANVKAIDSESILTPCHIAYLRNEFDIFRWLCEEGGFDIEGRDQRGDTFLNFVCSSIDSKLQLERHYIYIHYLIFKRKANLVTDEDDPKVLRLFCKWSDLTFIKTLMEKRNESFGTKKKECLLRCAVKAGRLDITKYFIEEIGLSCDPTEKWAYNLLHNAYESGNMTLVKYLVEKNGADVNAKNAKGNTLLHLTSISNSLNNLKYLSGLPGVEIDARNELEETPLHCASFRGHLETVKYLVEVRGANIKAVSNIHFLPFHYAIAGKEWDIAKYLIDRKGAPTILNKPEHDQLVSDGEVLEYLEEFGGKNYISKEIMKGFKETDLEEVVKYLIKLKRNEFTLKEDFEETVLSWVSGTSEFFEYLKNKISYDYITENESDFSFALLKFLCRQKTLYWVKFLFEKIGKIFKTVEARKESLLHFACIHGRLDIVKYLVDERQADLQAMDKKGNTPLHSTCSKRWSPSLEIAYLVEKCPFSLTSRNKEGQTPLHFACQRISIEIIKYLIEEKGANIEEVDYEGKTCLLLACEKGRFDFRVAKYLIEKKGANIEAKDSNGNTALMVSLTSEVSSYYSSYYLNKDLVEYLLHQKNTDINARNNEGQTVLHQACWLGQLNVVENLLEIHHADIETADEFGQTGLHMACKKGFYEIVEYLIVNHNSNIHKVTSAGESCLHLNCKVKELIEAHKVKNAKSSSKEPFEKEYRGFQNIAKVLIRKGINIFARDFQGKLAFDYVDKNYQPIMFHLLSSTMARYFSQGYYYCFCFEKKISEW